MLKLAGNDIYIFTLGIVNQYVSKIQSHILYN